MNRTIVVATALLLLSLFSFAPASHAVPITTLFSTGLTPSGTLLADFDPDPHYTLSSSPGGAFPVGPGIKVATAALPPGWTANTPTSQWINPTGLADDPADWHPGGVYVYTTTFSLAGYIPSTTSIFLGWAADDNDAGSAITPYDFIAVNGFPVPGSGTGTGPGSFAGLHAVLLDSTLPWLPGINTLDFVMANTDLDPGPGFTGPTGIHVHIVSADADLIPEPSSFVLLAGAGVMLLAFAWRRRQRKT